MDWCCDINDNYSINFNKSRENITKYITKYCELIRKYHDDQMYIANMNNLKNILNDMKNNMKNKDKNNKMILTTLRMSSYDVK